VTPFFPLVRTNHIKCRRLFSPGKKKAGRRSAARSLGADEQKTPPLLQSGVLFLRFHSGSSRFQ
jgi:hypothetical protein